MGLAIDGALVPVLHEPEWRQAMVGTSTLDDTEDEGLHVGQVAHEDDIALGGWVTA